jgi:hypothetical protein
MLGGAVDRIRAANAVENQRTFLWYAAASRAAAIGIERNGKAYVCPKRATLKLRRCSSSNATE